MLSLQIPAVAGFSALLTLASCRCSSISSSQLLSFGHPKQLYHHYFRQQILLKLRFNLIYKRTTAHKEKHTIGYYAPLFLKFLSLPQEIPTGCFLCLFVCFYLSCQQFLMLLFPTRLFLPFSLLSVCQGSFPPTPQESSHSLNFNTQSNLTLQTPSSLLDHSRRHNHFFFFYQNGPFRIFLNKILFLGSSGGFEDTGFL